MPTGETIAQGDHMPVHLGAMPLSVRAAIDASPMDPGDIVVLNDPFRGGTHLPDITLVSPVFIGRGRPAGVLCRQSRASLRRRRHEPGLDATRARGLSGRADHPADQAGAARRDRRRTSWRMILANVRTPDEREGDITAQIASNRVGESRLRDIVSKYGRARVDGYAAGLQDYTERLLRRDDRRRARWRVQLRRRDG